MQIASSANRTCRLLRSASEYTATVRMPISLQAEITRSAISPRLAISTLRNMSFPWPWTLALLDREQRLSVLHRLTGLHEHLDDLTRSVALDLVHQLHRFHDAQ